VPIQKAVDSKPCGFNIRIALNIQDIIAIVKQYDTLEFQENKGERLRIRRGDTRPGSLWVGARRTYGGLVTANGEVLERMCNFLQTNFGDGRKGHKGTGKEWKMKNDDDVTRVIQHFGGSAGGAGPRQV
jgi:hypothetical protein